MKILSIDTAGGFCSVAMCDDGKIIAHIDDLESGKQAERLFGIVESILVDVDIKYNQLNAVAVNIGPGTFTGVRLGLAAAKGIKLVNKIPVVAVTSLESVAYKAAYNDKDIFVVLDARRKQVYCQKFDVNLSELSKPSLLDYDQVSQIDLNNAGLVGNGVNLVESYIVSKGYHIIDSELVSDSRSVAQVAFIKIKNSLDTNNVSPLYIRKPDAVKSS